MQKSYFLFLVVLLLSQVSVGQTGDAQTTAAPPEQQTAQPAAPQQKPLSNDDVIGMVTAGLPDDIIIAKIKSSQTNFDLSTPALAKLTQAKVSSAIIKTMIDPKADTGPTAVAPAPASTVTVNLGGTGKLSGATPGAGVSEAELAANANNPDTPHDSGIYLYTENETSRLKEMIPLERTSTQGTKTGVLGHALSYGIVKGKTKAVIPGPQASVLTRDSKPVFYFYFENKSAALGKSHGFGEQTVSNPNQFSLLRLEEKKDHREVVVGTIGFASASSGSESKEMIPFQADRIRPGVYKVVPVADVKPGQYAFASASASGATGAADIFDFGVKQNK